MLVGVGPDMLRRLALDSGRETGSVLGRRLQHSLTSKTTVELGRGEELDVGDTAFACELDV